MKNLERRSIIEEYVRSYPDYESDRRLKYSISEKLKVPPSKVQSVVSFFDQGNRENKVCSGLPCYLKGNGKGGSSSSQASCLGYCDKAPVTEKDHRFFSIAGGETLPLEESNKDYVANNRQGIDSYIATGGYGTLIKWTDGMDLISTLEKTGLRGMGGAGFPVAMKWKSFRSSIARDGVLVVNAHEGEPGTFKDRIILELTPHSVLDGALLAALSNRIRKVVIGIKSEYEGATFSLKKALDEFNQKFSPSIGSGRFPEIEIMSVPGSYVTGEETALMEAIQGNRGEPRLRPPFPTEAGLYGTPTLVHNAETLAAISEIALGGDFTKSYCLTGDVKRPGMYRTKMGITARDLVESSGGTETGDLKAFMPGGLSGGILPLSKIDTPLDYDSMRKIGAGLGTGSVIAFSRDRCIVDIMTEVEDFFRLESCGKCFPCRYGTEGLSGLLHRLKNGQANAADVEGGKEVAQTMIDGSICALGQAAGKVFLDAIKHFGNEFTDHTEKKCEANVCNFGRRAN